MLFEKFDSHRPLHIEFRQVVDLQKKKPIEHGWLFCYSAKHALYSKMQILAACFSAQQFALVEIFFEDLQTGQRVFEFEQLLFGQFGNRQDFAEPVADPVDVVVAMRFGNAFGAEVGDDSPEQGEEALAFAGKWWVFGLGEQFDAGAEQFVVADSAFQDAKAPRALGDDHQDAELFHFPVADRGQRADRVRFGGCADFAAAGDQADAEGRAVLEAGGGHVEVALFEYFQRQQAAGKEHGTEWKQRDVEGFDRGAAGRANEVEPAHYSPQRRIRACGTATWSSTRATTKSTISWTLCGWW